MPFPSIKEIATRSMSLLWQQSVPRLDAVRIIYEGRDIFYTFEPSQSLAR
jgi:hypothetical protein